jgi:hypothetical protein
MAPKGSQQVSSKSQTHDLSGRLQDLELGHKSLRREIEGLLSTQAGLHQAVEDLRKGSWSVNVGPFQTENASIFRKKLDELKNETVQATNETTLIVPKGEEKPAASNAVLPPHLRAKAKPQNGASALPPHLRTKGANSSLVTDGKVDSEATPLVLRPAPAPAPTPPPSETTTATTGTSFQPDVPRQSVEEPYVAASCLGWMPYALRDQPMPSTEVLESIPTSPETVTFSYDFLNNFLGGMTWSPGLKYIPPSPTEATRHILPARTYYLIDAKYEPYMPREPGQHGAKLTAFFNKNPDEVNPDYEFSFDDVPLFISNTPFVEDKHKMRYVYFGNYSQTRWSDKLDYDRMVEHVPQAVKLYWAEELSAVGRAEWVTEAMKNHFFPKPEYEGSFPVHVDNQPEGSVAPEEEGKKEEKFFRDFKEYIGQLKGWDKEATMKTKMIKKNFILEAFERVSFKHLSETVISRYANKPPGRRRRPPGSPPLVGVSAVHRIQQGLLQHARHAPDAQQAVPQLRASAGMMLSIWFLFSMGVFPRSG